MTLKERIRIGSAFAKWLDAATAVNTNPTQITARTQQRYDAASERLHRTLRASGFTKLTVKWILENLEKDVNIDP